MPFFELLQSQLLQRMLKSAAAQKGGQVKTEYLKKFIDIMVSFGEQVSIPEEHEETYELAQAVQVMLEPSSPPSKITESHALISGSQHWIAQAFGMENGKKVLKLSTENAERRLQSDGILGKVDAKTTSLREAISECETGKYEKSFGTLSHVCDQIIVLFDYRL